MEINKKEIIAQYKARPEKSGVYSITCVETGKIFLDSVLDLQGSQNRFNFSAKTGGCMQMKLQADWKKYTGSGFEFKILEEIEIKEGQSKKEFLVDIKLLKKMWLEKLEGNDVY